jgi:hypothetical protein
MRRKDASWLAISKIEEENVNELSKMWKRKS